MEETDGCSGGFWFYLTVKEFQDNMIEILNAYGKIDVEFVPGNKKNVMIWISVKL